MVILSKYIQNLKKPNIPSPAQFQKKYKKDFIIKLDYNENKFGAAPGLKNAIKINSPFIYPEFRDNEIFEELSKHWNVPQKHIYVSNGSDSILDEIPSIFLDHDKKEEVIIPSLTYGRIEQTCLAYGIKIKKIPLVDYKINLNATLKAITKQTRIVYLVNPNMPTGTIKTEKEIVEFLNKVPSDILVVIDHAYSEYVTDKNFIKCEAALLKKYKNLIITHTFSKFYGLSAFRIGYFLCNDQRIVDAFCKVYQALPVSKYSIQAATFAIKHNSWYKNNVLVNTKKSYKFFCKALEQMNVKYIESQANFLFIDTQSQNLNNEKIAEYLLKNYAISIRPVKDIGLRITIGTKKEMNKLIIGLKAYLKTYGI